MRQPRREFLLRLAALAPVPFLARRLHVRAVNAQDPAMLRAVADAVLPSELGAGGVERAAAEFERWLAGYREGAEVLHGYGTGTIRRTGPSPALRWSRQLADLDAAARQKLGGPFAGRSRPERQGLVRAALAGFKPGGLPDFDQAPHIAVGLLAHYYGSSGATDLCYGARIGKATCRPLSQSAERPLPLARRS